MARFYTSEKKVTAPKALEVECESLDIQGRGVCKKDGMVYFVEDLMPSEIARVVPFASNGVAGSLSSKDKFFSAKVTKYIKTSDERRAQSCPLQDQCGGCPLEHLPYETALSAKIEGVASLLRKSVIQGTKEAKSTKVSTAKGSSKLGRNSTIKHTLAKKQAAAKNAAKQKELDAVCIQAADLIAEPSFVLRSDEVGYRRACRLAIRGDHGKLHLGFRGAKTKDLVPVTNCEVLTERNNALLEPLKAIVNRMESKKSIGHVELLDSDGAVGVLLRMTEKLNAKDELLLKDFSKEYSVVVSVLEPFKQLDDTEVVRERIITDESDEDARRMFVMSNDCKIFCSPSSFVQVNGKLNQLMIEQVLKEVEPSSEKKVLDLFSGLGNFSLPVAKAGATVVGIDIVSDMVRRANENAKENGIDAEKARFFVADLEEPFESQLWAKDSYDVVVMDPGRSGAKRSVSFMGKLKPKKIIMISCNPLAAARDCIQLIGSGYKLDSWGAIDMFPRTTHIEIMLVFSPEQKQFAFKEMNQVVTALTIIAHGAFMGQLAVTIIRQA